MTNFLTILIS